MPRHITLFWLVGNNMEPGITGGKRENLGAGGGGRRWLKSGKVAASHFLDVEANCLWVLNLNFESGRNSGTTDERFHKSFGFISLIHLATSPMNECVGEAQLKKWLGKSSVCCIQGDQFAFVTTRLPFVAAGDDVTVRRRPLGSYSAISAGEQRVTCNIVT